MLDNLSTKRTQLEKEMKGKAKGSVTRKMTPLRKKVETELLDLAKSMHCTSGKWLLFPRVEDVDSIWGIVARETVLGNLGMAAKVATREDGGDGGGEEGGGGGTGGGARLICVYTTDFSDRADVKRVLERMRKLTLLRGQGGTGEERGIYYKCGEFLTRFLPFLAIYCSSNVVVVISPNLPIRPYRLAIPCIYSTHQSN